MGGSENQRTVAAKPFTRPVGVNSELHQNIADEYTKDVDGKGASITGLGSAIIEDVIRMGSSILCAESMSVGLSLPSLRRSHPRIPNGRG